jgi:hypothetical protein
MITLMVMALSMLLKVGEFLSSTKSACWLSPFCRKLASLSSVSFAEDKKAHTFPTILHDIGEN